MGEGLDCAGDGLDGSVVELDDTAEALDCTEVVSGNAVEAPDHIVVVLDGTVEEQGCTGTAQDPPVVGVAQPVIAGEGKLVPSFSFGLTRQR